MTSLIKISDYTQRLDRLRALEKTEIEIQEEFVRVTREIFGATLEDLSHEQFWQACKLHIPAEEAKEFATRNGYDITLNGRMLNSWQSYIILIIAKMNNLLPTLQEIAERKLQQEAIMFKASSSSNARKTGHVKTYNPEKGYGFIYPDIFVHKSEVQRLGLDKLHKEQFVSFEVIEESKGPKAINLLIPDTCRRTYLENSYHTLKYIRENA